VTQTNYLEPSALNAARHLQACLYAYSLFVFGGQRSEVVRWMSSADLKGENVFPSVFEKRIREKVPVKVTETWAKGFKMWTTSVLFVEFAPFYHQYNGATVDDDHADFYGTEFKPVLLKQRNNLNQRMLWFNTTVGLLTERNRKSNALLLASYHFSANLRYAWYLIDRTRWPNYKGMQQCTCASPFIYIHSFLFCMLFLGSQAKNLVFPTLADLRHLFMQAHLDVWEGRDKEYMKAFATRNDIYAYLAEVRICYVLVQCLATICFSSLPFFSPLTEIQHVRRHDRKYIYPARGDKPAHQDEDRCLFTEEAERWP
jgi:hypothetical protein